MRSAKRVAAARPMPPAPPVITGIRPSSFPMEPPGAARYRKTSEMFPWCWRSGKVTAQAASENVTRIGSTKPLNSSSATGSVSRKSPHLSKERTDHGEPPVARGEDREVEADGDARPCGDRASARRRSPAPMVDPGPEDRAQVLD